MVYGYKEIRKISAASLRNLCIEKDWYTKGDSDDYKHLLFVMADHKENITTDDIVEIAQDIVEHSDLEGMEFTGVCFEVARIAVTFFEEA